MKKDVSLQLLERYQQESFLNKLHIYIRLRRAFFDIVETYLPKKGKILDYGCGHGFFSYYLFCTGVGRNVVGVDISKRKIAIAKKDLKKEKITFTTDQNVLELKTKNSYDGICILNVLYLVNRKQKEKIIKKAYNALKKNGKLLIAELDASSRFMIFLTVLREYIMVHILHLTKGSLIAFEKNKWWEAQLKQYFKSVRIKNFKTRGYQKLYICKKN